MLAFKDPERKIFVDGSHSSTEQRFFCLGKVGDEVLTVRFTYRDDMIRIFGVGYWREGRKDYDETEE